MTPSGSSPRVLGVYLGASFLDGDLAAVNPPRTFESFDVGEMTRQLLTLFNLGHEAVQRLQHPRSRLICLTRSQPATPDTPPLGTLDLRTCVRGGGEGGGRQLGQNKRYGSDLSWAAVNKSSTKPVPISLSKSEIG